MREVEIAGVATTSFGRHLDRSLQSLTAEAVRGALSDGDLRQDDVEAVVFSNAAEGVLRGQEMIRAQVAMKGTGLEGLPMFNTENACASGSSATHLAWLMVASGQIDVALVVGTEKLHHEDKQRSFDAIESGTDLSLTADHTVAGSVMMAAYAEEARAYAQAYGEIEDVLAAIAVKNRGFAGQTRHAQFRDPITIDDVMGSRLVADPLRLLTCSPMTDGSAALVLRAADARIVGERPKVRIAASCVRSHRPGGSVVEDATTAAYRMTDCSVTDVDVFQVHDACAFAELIQYEQIGLAGPGGGPRLVAEGQTGAGGDHPTNTDGGLLSRGHALGATGVAQLVELTWQLQGRAGSRQVSEAATALAVNAGGWMGDDYATCVSTVLAT